MEEKLGTGAIHSIKDKRNIQHKDITYAGAPLIQGGEEYQPEDHEHQHNVGICTAISRVQLRQKQTGKKYSPEFQYLLQKKFIDKNWIEGSSVLSANKVAKNYGFLPAEYWTHTTEQDRYLPYSVYASKLSAISDGEVNRLLALCTDKIAGYAQVDITDPQAIARAIDESPMQAGILCRYGCQNNWWTPSWLAKDIDPLRYAPETSGHAIIMSAFDYIEKTQQLLANTWGKDWCLNGNAHIIHSDYPPTEAFVDMYMNPMFQFTQTMKFGSRGNEVKELQKRLNMPTILNTGFFGTITKKYVMNYQTAHQLVPDGVVGKLTLAELNK